MWRRSRHRSLRLSVTVAVTAGIAVPVVVVAAFAAVFVRDEATWLDSVALSSHVLCSPVTEATQQDLGFDRTEAVQAGRPHYCVERVERVDAPLTAEESTGRIASASRTPHEITLTPQLSLWPWTDTQRVTYRITTDDERILAGFDAERLLSPEQRGRLSNAQQALNEQVVLLAYGAVLLIALFGGIVWIATGRVLRPVEAIRQEVADITEHDLTRRVAVPRTYREIAVLATTLNTTLDRLETAVVQNRRFVADASHELRSPITALRAELEIATAHPDLADWPAVVDAALADTDRLQHLATDLLLLSRLDDNPAAAVDQDTVDLTALVREEVELRRTRHALTIDTADDPVPVRGSRALLRRLLGNLLDNAERHATTAVTVRLTTTGDHAVLDVLDDGPGIPPEHRERVFDRFTRLDDARTRDTGGTGLGLPIARRIATTHGGSLHVTGHPTGGARLTATLPLR
ncbi:HAMP domain-containing sensor histidine kinase [Actinosynnema sp. NPDC050801]|uniref:sensor histidine kinase n=1 Tax=unclassified Actinosynnema TaxID=2637065 RepID=UPI0033C6E07F